MDNETAQAVEAVRDDLIALRRDLHAHPELALREQRTAGIVAARMRAAGLEVATGIAGTGVVGLLRGARPGPTLAIRADMDAVPISEENDVPYRSTVEGAMHACGHDGHTAVSAVVAQLLARQRDALHGNVKFIFQPGEEQSAGGRPMLEAGVLREPPVDAVVGLHLWNAFPVGTVGILPGTMLAGLHNLTITIIGRAGHISRPFQGVDSIVVAAQVLTALQTLVSRETDARQVATLTFHTIHGGGARGVIAPSVTLAGSLRSFDEALGRHLVSRAEALATGIAEAMRAGCAVQSSYDCPPAVNDPAIAERVRRAAVGVVGAEGIRPADQSLGCDDMAYFLQAVPGCYFSVGSANPARGLNHLNHTARFDIDEEALVIAAKVLLTTARDYLSAPVH